MVDADVVLFLEVDPSTREPLALVEVAVDVGQLKKPATATARMAAKAGLPAFCVLYGLTTQPNPCDHRVFDISGFRVQRLWPQPERSFRTLTPDEWANALVKIREWAAARIDVAANDEFFAPIQRQARLFE
jgi:hypothetical protein